jgi:AcrR family transcriptional regulator
VTRGSGRSHEWLAGGDTRRVAGREKILSAAADLFAEHGADDVTVEQVAERAGCSRATLYRYVGGKSAILERVMFRNGLSIVTHVARYLEQVHQADRPSAAVHACLAEARSDRTIMGMLAKSSVEQFRTYFTTMSDPSMFATALGLDLSAQDAQVFARTLLSLLTWPADNADAERHLVTRMIASPNLPDRQTAP